MSDLIIGNTSNPTIEQSQEAFNPAQVTMPQADMDFTTRETHNENDLSGHTGKNATFTKTTVHDTNENINGDDTHPEHPLQDDDRYGSKVGGEHFQDDVAGYATKLANNEKVRSKVHLGDAQPASHLWEKSYGDFNLTGLDGYTRDRETPKSSDLQLMPMDIDLPKPIKRIGKLYYKPNNIKTEYDNQSIRVPSDGFIQTE